MTSFEVLCHLLLVYIGVRRVGSYTHTSKQHHHISSSLCKQVLYALICLPTGRVLQQFSHPKLDSSATLAAARGGSAAAGAAAPGGALGVTLSISAAASPKGGGANDMGGWVAPSLLPHSPCYFSLASHDDGLS